MIHEYESSTDKFRLVFCQLLRSKVAAALAVFGSFTTKLLSKATCYTHYSKLVCAPGLQIACSKCSCWFCTAPECCMQWTTL